MKRTLIAVAVLAAASGSAFAHDHLKDPFIFNSTAVGEQVGEVGWVTLFGCVQVSSSAGAVVNNNQNVWVNAKLDPLPGSYTSGTVTTKINANDFSVKGGGSASLTTWSNQASVSAGAQGFEESSAYGYHNQSSAIQGGGYEYSNQSAGVQGGGYEYSNQNAGVQGGGYEYSNQNASIGGGFSAQQQSSNGHISAGGQAGGSSSYYSDHTRNGGSSNYSTQGGFSGGYNESSASESSGIHGGFGASEGSGQGAKWGYSANEGSGQGAKWGYSADEGSGQGAKWGFSADEGSGSQGFAEQSSGYKAYASHTSASSGAIWGINANLDVSDVSVSGSITQHIDTQAPTVLTATTGSNAGSGISGNVGINITEGVDNAQSNDVSLASVDAGDVFGNAQIFNTQSTGGSAHVKNYTFNASIGDQSLGQVSGNVGVNVASGVGNAQNNSLAASTSLVSPGSASAVAMVATDDNNQSANMSFSGSMNGTAVLGANSLQGSQGNIGVNIAGGVGNVQHNGLAIAASSIGH
jgi:hypothetical protein